MAGKQGETVDELSRSSLPSEGREGSEDNSLLNGTNNAEDIPYNDLAEFAQLVEDHIALISEPARVEEGWRKIFAEGKESDYDWADEEWTNGEKLLKQLQAKAEVWRKATRASKGRPGMSLRTYDNIVRYLKTRDYPEEMEDNPQGKWNFRIKCEAYFLHTNGMLGYRKMGLEKYVLLEGEVEDLILQIHRDLGHASYGYIKKVVEKNFFADCALLPVVKRLSRCAVQDEDSVSKTDVCRVSVSVERVCQRVSVQVYLDGVRRTKSTKDCLQISSENGEVGMPLERYKNFSDFVRRGIVPERYSKYNYNFRKCAAKYAWSAQGLVTVAGEKLVLNHSEAAEVILQLHETYGHVPGRKLSVLLGKRFDCLAFSTFCEDLCLRCPFCMLRGKNSSITTPPELYSNAQYDVDVKWEGEKRVISINPIGLDKKAVAKYVERIEKECGEKNKDKLPAAEVSLTDENADLYRKVLSISEVMLEKERSRLPAVNLPADIPLNCHGKSESDANNRPDKSVPRRRDRKRKDSPMRNTALSAPTMVTRKKARSNVDRTVMNSFGIDEPDSGIENSAIVSLGAEPYLEETQPEMDQTVDDVPSEHINVSRDVLDGGQVALEPRPIHEPSSPSESSCNCEHLNLPLRRYDKPSVVKTECSENCQECQAVNIPIDEDVKPFTSKKPKEEIKEIGNEPKLVPAVSQEHKMQNEPSLLDLQSERDALKRERTNLEREKKEFELLKREKPKNHLLDELAAVREENRRLGDENRQLGEKIRHLEGKK